MIPSWLYSHCNKHSFCHSPHSRGLVSPSYHILMTEDQSGLLELLSAALCRCLDESEDSAPAPPPPPPGVPDCPICGKRFKSQKSRAAHLKRCSSDMGVAPAVLLQALQRQAAETQSAPAWVSLCSDALSVFVRKMVNFQLQLLTPAAPQAVLRCSQGID